MQNFHESGKKGEKQNNDGEIEWDNFISIKYIYYFHINNLPKHLRHQYEQE